jgi:hypothetical protein
MTKANSPTKTPQQIRAETAELIRNHQASVQGWLAVHHPAASSAEGGNLVTTHSSSTPSAISLNKPSQ